MKRDFELIKQILIKIEGSTKVNDWIKIDSTSYSNEEINYHIKLLAVEGLIEADDVSSLSETKWIPTSLTWKGHEFLDNARNDTIWKKTISLVKEKGGSVSFSIFHNLLQSQATKLFEDL